MPWRHSRGRSLARLRSEDRREGSRLALGAEGEDADAGRNRRADRLVGRFELAADDDEVRLRHRQRVHQRSAGQVRVDERDVCARLDEAEPGGEVLGAVLHEQRRAATVDEPFGPRPVRDSIGQAVELGVSESPPLEDHRGMARRACRRHARTCRRRFRHRRASRAAFAIDAPEDAERAQLAANLGKKAWHALRPSPFRSQSAPDAVGRERESDRATAFLDGFVGTVEIEEPEVR